MRQVGRGSPSPLPSGACWTAADLTRTGPVWRTLSVTQLHTACSKWYADGYADERFTTIHHPHQLHTDACNCMLHILVYTAYLYYICMYAATTHTCTHAAHLSRRIYGCHAAHMYACICAAQVHTYFTTPAMVLPQPSLLNFTGCTHHLATVCSVLRDSWPWASLKSQLAAQSFPCSVLCLGF